MSDSTETPGLAAARKALDTHTAWFRTCGDARPEPPEWGHLRVALAEVGRLSADLSALRLEHEAVCGLLTHTRGDRDKARARVAELESRPTYEAAVRVCARITERAVMIEHAHTAILALLEPKP